MPEVADAKTAASEAALASSSSSSTPHSKGRVGRAVLWCGLIAVALIGGILSWVAYDEGLPSPFQTFPQLDKVLHFGLGGAMAFFLDPILRRRMVRFGRVAVPLSAIVVLIPAGIEEYLQRYSEYRSSDIWDFLADVVGVTFFIWLSRRTTQ